MRISWKALPRLPARKPKCFRVPHTDADPVHAIIEVRDKNREGSMDIQFTTQVFKEGRTFVAYTPQLDVSSCGGSKERAVRNLREAVRLFLDEAAHMGTLDQILEEAGFLRRKSQMVSPKLVGTRQISIALPEHAEV